MFAREIDILYAAVNLRTGAFNGVATGYLPNYLGWRWILDASRILSPESLLKASLDIVTHLTVA